jgi:hypothetical protein
MGEGVCSWGGVVVAEPLGGEAGAGEPEEAGDAVWVRERSSDMLMG